jgi:hypothetical protein
VKRLIIVVLLLFVSACGARTQSGNQSGAAALRGFGIDVDQAISARLPAVHLKTCGSWGCNEQDVPLSIAGPTSAAACPGSPDVACSDVHLPGPGPGYGYAAIPELTADPVTVTVSTPPSAPLRIDAEVRVQPHEICTNAQSCVPQATLRIAADGSVSQSR